MTTHRWPVTPVRGVKCRSPGGAPMEGNLTSIEFVLESSRCSKPDQPKIVGHELTIPRTNQAPLVVPGIASPVHIPGKWTFYVGTYPANPGWPPKGKQQPLKSAAPVAPKAKPGTIPPPPPAKLTR